MTIGIDPTEQGLVIDIQSLLDNAPQIKLAELCRQCGFSLNLMSPAQRDSGSCLRCRQEVCYICGCTMNHPCIKRCSGGQLTCSWMTSGVCDFCFHRLLEQVYLNLSNPRAALIQVVRAELGAI